MSSRRPTGVSLRGRGGGAAGAAVGSAAASLRRFARRSRGKGTLRAARAPVFEREFVTVAEDVELQIEDRHDYVRRLLGNVRIRLADAIDDVDGAGAEHLQAVRLRDDRRVLVDA